MKLKAIHIGLIIILVLSIVMITSSDSIVPYSRSTLFSNMHKYEGMENQPSSPEQGHSQQSAKAPEPLDQSMFQKLSETLAKSMNGEQSSPDKKPSANENGTAMVEGFALQPSPLNSSEDIDRYSKVTSSPNCFGKSSGYSNSMGPLCLAGDDLRLLSTRGGNISGTDSTIGN